MNYIHNLVIQIVIQYYSTAHKGAKILVLRDAGEAVNQSCAFQKGGDEKRKAAAGHGRNTNDEARIMKDE